MTTCTCRNDPELGLALTPGCPVHTARQTIAALATKTLNCPHCGVESAVGVSELEAAYRLGVESQQARVQDLEGHLRVTREHWDRDLERLVAADAKVQELERERDSYQQSYVKALDVIGVQEDQIRELEREVAKEKERTSLMYGRWEEQGKRADELEREVAALKKGIDDVVMGLQGEASLPVTDVRSQRVLREAATTLTNIKGKPISLGQEWVSRVTNEPE